MTLNDTLQAAGVAIVLICAVIWIVRRACRKKNDCGCADCPIREKCGSKNKS